MAKLESTAIKDFIQLVGNRPLQRDSQDELLFQPPAAIRGPRLVADRAVPSPAPAPVAFVAPLVAHPANDQFDQHAVTMPVARRRASPHFKVPVRPLVIAALALSGVGIVAGTVRWLRHDSPASPAAALVAAKPVAAPVIAPKPQIIAPKPVAAPVSAPDPVRVAPAPVAAVPAPVAPAPVVPTPPPIARIALVLESQPAGATVTMIDNATSSVLGTTPLNTSVDASHGYDFVFALKGKTPKLEHLDPQTTQRLTVAFDAPVEVAPAPAKRHHARVTRKPQKSVRPTSK